MGFPARMFGALELYPHAQARDRGARVPIWGLGLLSPRSHRSYPRDVSDVHWICRRMRRELFFGTLLAEGRTTVASLWQYVSRCIVSTCL